MDKNKEEILEHAQSHGLRRALVVTALSLEMRAVRAHISQLGSVPGRSGAIYECGQFSADNSEWLVIVAESGAGNHPAQNIVTAAHVDFNEFEVVIFVGIAGSRKDEAPVGSVVASSYLYSPYSGKYDANGFSARPHSIPVDQHLVGCAKKVERDENWVERIKKPLKTKLPAEADYPQPFPPSAIVAPIVSTEAVSADPKSDLEKIITQHFGDALAVEMEGYGAAYAAYSERTPFIVIRGISDKRKGKKPRTDAINQPVAAAHAAAFAFELLNIWGRFKPTKDVLPLLGSGTNNAAPNSAPLGSKKNIFVLNFSGSADDFPQERIDEIVQTLKTLTEDDTLQVVGSEEGSFHLFIESIKDIQKCPNIAKFSEILKSKHSANLLGVVSKDEYLQEQSFEKALRNASIELLDWPQTLPDGTYLERPELDSLLSTISDQSSSTTAVLGPPGSGKSALLACLGQRLSSQGIPFLAIKADLLTSSIQTTKDLSESLSLPMNVESLLLQVSQFKTVVLLIDQLDALASYIDLRTGRLSVLLNMVRALGGTRNIHIILSARTFEFEHDTRLKSVRAESLNLTLPPWSTVLQILKNNNVEAAGWPTDAQELIRAPQVLSTFLKLKHQTNQPPFGTYQAMLDQLWSERILSQPKHPNLAKLASSIAEQMAETESLWIATAKFDDRAEDIKALIANGILIDDGSRSRIGFSHQTIFEHALARSFVSGQGRLSTYILERQSSLFIRPKLWAALTYLRDVDPTNYHAEVQTLWNTADLRLHLQHMLIEFLGQQNSPTSSEILLFDQALLLTNRRIALQAMVGSAGWFSLLAHTHISSAMLDSQEINVAIAILDRAWLSSPDLVKELIEKNWLPNPAFDEYIWQVLQNKLPWDEEITQISEAILGRTDISHFSFEYSLSVIGVEQPEVALRLAVKKLGLQVAQAIKATEAHASSPPTEDRAERISWLMTNSPERYLTQVIEQQNGWDWLEAIAKQHGKLFLEYLWQPFKLAIDALCRLENSSSYLGFPLDYKLDLRLPDENSLGLPTPPILAGLIAAFETFASEDKDAFLAWLSIHEHQDAEPVQRLFAHALASQPEVYAERAATFLLSDKRRLHLGGVDDSMGTTKRLIDSVSPLWNQETLNNFSNEVMAYAPSAPAELSAESRKRFNDAIRHTRLSLLTKLPIDRLPEAIRKYISEERRRFPNDDEIRTTFHGPKWIGSPMSAQNMALAADADIINAFRQIPDASSWDHPKRWMEGGNIQLSREFAEFSKTNPERAIGLIRQLEPDFGSRAAGYAVDALAEAATPAAVITLIVDLKARGFGGAEYHGSIARAVQRLTQRDAVITDDTLSILESWLTEPTPETDEENEALEASESRGEKSDEKDSDAGSILWGLGGIYALPHGNYPILEAITRVLLGRGEHDRLLALYFKHLNLKEDPTIWRPLLQFIYYIRPSDASALGEFILKLFAKYPELEKTREAVIMLAHLQWRIPDITHTIIRNWCNAADKMQLQGYGELVALTSLVQPDLDWAKKLLSEIVARTDIAYAQIGAIHAAVNLWAESEADYGSNASNLLQQLMPLATKKGWSAIFSLFRLVDEIQPKPEWISFLKALDEHLPKSDNSDYSFIVDRLQTLLPHNANLVASIAKKLVEKWRSELGDVRSGAITTARELVDLAITLHRLSPETREIGISLFEDLLVINAYTARETLDEIDNRFRSTATPPPRQRLPRRAARPRPRRPS